VAAVAEPNVRRLLRARDLLHAEYGGPVRIDDLAGAAGLSRWHFQRCFRAVFGVAAHDYLSRLRLQRAKEALARGVSVTETCMEVGFTSLGTFSTWFARGTGEPPRRWQQAMRRLVVVPQQLPLIWIPGCFLGGCTPSTIREVRAEGPVVRASP
jgi:AraC-like DNA-binding protein